MLIDNMIWLKHDDGTEYVPLVGKLEHMFNSVVTPSSDVNFGSKGSMRNLLNGSKAHIGRWRKGRRERCTSQPHKTPSQTRLARPLLQKFFRCARPDCSALRRTIPFMEGGASKKAAGKKEKNKNTQLAAAVLELKEP